MKVWITMAEDQIDHISYIISIWDNREAAEYELIKLQAENNFCISYGIDEREVKTKIPLDK